MHAIVFEVFGIQNRALSAATLTVCGEGALCVRCALNFGYQEMKGHSMGAVREFAMPMRSSWLHAPYHFISSSAHFNYIL